MNIIHCMNVLLNVFDLFSFFVRSFTKYHSTNVCGKTKRKKDVKEMSGNVFVAF